MTAMRRGGMPLPGKREALFEGDAAAAALAEAETAAALTARFSDEQEDGKTGRLVDGSDARADASVGPPPAKLPVFPPSCELSPHVCRSIAGTLPTRPVFHGIGSTSAWVSTGPRARTLPARLTPACSWPWV